MVAGDTGYDQQEWAPQQLCLPHPTTGCQNRPYRTSEAHMALGATFNLRSHLVVLQANKHAFCYKEPLSKRSTGSSPSMARGLWMIWYYRVCLPVQPLFSGCSSLMLHLHLCLKVLTIGLLTKYAVAFGADGSLTICTPCDPLFVSLPLLVAARQEVSCTPAL